MSTVTGTLSQRARAARDAGRMNEAVFLYHAATVEKPLSAAAEHNLAACLGDFARWEEAEAATRRAMAKGSDAAETWLVRARALQALGRIDDARSAYEAAISRRSDMIDAHQEHAQLIWMSTGSAEPALRGLRAMIAAHPSDARFVLALGQALAYTGQPEDGCDLLVAASQRFTEDVDVRIAASQAAIACGRLAEGLSLAAGAVRRRPGSAPAHICHAEAALANGAAADALLSAESALAIHPDNQHAIALFATACRARGDARWNALYDYERLVKSYTIDVPDGWPSISAYLSELSIDIAHEHPFRAHPFNQSLRGGSQAVNILYSSRPALRAFASALQGPIARYIDTLATAPEPLRRRYLGSYAFKGMWSVRLHAGGRHVSHVHPAGWISSACYLQLPDAPEPEGWIEFGRPGIPCQPDLPAEYRIRPEAGMLVLFPSYMWHGTIPFATGERLTAAFDLRPAAPGSDETALLQSSRNK